MFADAMEAFGPNVLVVRGTRVAAKSRADNLIAYQRARRSFFWSPDRAAFRTFNGEMSRRAEQVVAEFR